MEKLLNFFWRFVPAPMQQFLRRTGVTTVVWSWLTGPYEPDVTGAIRRIVRKGSVCADVGANVGVITELLARLAGPKGRVFAFEAHPETCRQLIQRMQNKGLRQVQVENVAVSDGSCERVWLSPGRGRNPSEWNIMGHDVKGNPTKSELEIAAISLDSYFPPGSRLNFIKIDVEGAEAQVLAGMRRLLRDSKPAVLVEFHDETGWAGRKELLAAGYRMQDMNEQWKDPDQQVQRIFHCLFLPQE